MFMGLFVFLLSIFIQRNHSNSHNILTWVLNEAEVQLLSEDTKCQRQTQLWLFFPLWLFLQLFLGSDVSIVPVILSLIDCTSYFLSYASEKYGYYLESSITLSTTYNVKIAMIFLRARWLDTSWHVVQIDTWQLYGWRVLCSPETLFFLYDPSMIPSKIFSYDHVILITLSLTCIYAIALYKCWPQNSV